MQAASQPDHDRWFGVHAWEAAQLESPALRDTPVADALHLRRSLHADLLIAMRSDRLTDGGTREALRLLAVLRASDRTSARLVLNHKELAWPRPSITMPGRARDDMFQWHPARGAAHWMELPMAGVVLAEHQLGDPGDTDGYLMSSAAGPCASAMARDAWGPTESAICSAPEAPWDWGGYWVLQSDHYRLPATPELHASGDLVALLNSEEASVRLSPASSLIRAQREAEQWVAQAFANEDPGSPAADLRHKPGRDAESFGDYCFFVDGWPPDRDAPGGLAPDTRLGCIVALAEMRSPNASLVRTLADNLACAPEEWPHRVSPAGFALARIGLRAIPALEWPRVHETSVERERRLDVIGLMLGRYARVVFQRERLRGTRLWPGIDDDIAYLEREYAGAKGIYEYIPDEPPRAE